MYIQSFARKTQYHMRLIQIVGHLHNWSIHDRVFSSVFPSQCLQSQRAGKMFLSVLSRLQKDIYGKRYICRPSFCDYWKFSGSLSNHLAKLLSHLSRGNEAATENHVQHTSICMACLADTDLLPGLVVQPIAIAVDLKRILSVGPFCVLEKLYQVALSTAGLDSSMSPFLISGDRCIAAAIKHPLRYQEIVTGRRVKRGVLVLAWAGAPGMGHCCVFHNSRLCFHLAVNPP